MQMAVMIVKQVATKKEVNPSLNGRWNQALSAMTTKVIMGQKKRIKTNLFTLDAKMCSFPARLAGNMSETQARSLPFIVFVGA